MRAFVMLAVLGCGNSGKQSPRVIGRAVCVEAADTVELDNQRPQSDAVAGCRTWPRYEVVEEAVRGICGPCGFTFDRAATVEQREHSPNACCYTIASPPPPPRP